MLSVYRFQSPPLEVVIELVCIGLRSWYLLLWVPRNFHEQLGMESAAQLASQSPTLSGLSYFLRKVTHGTQESNWRSCDPVLLTVHMVPQFGGLVHPTLHVPWPSVKTSLYFKILKIIT